MPTTPVGKVFAGLELLMVLGGLVLLWRHFLGARSTRDTRPAAAPPALPRWRTGGLDIATLVWLVLCGGILFQVTGMGLLRAIGLEGTRLLVIVSACFQLGMLVGCLCYMRFTTTGRDYDRPRKGFLLAGTATFLMSLPPVFSLGIGWQALMNLFGIPIDQQEMIALFKNTDNLPLLGLMIALAALLAPLTEELIFRAGLFRMLHGQVSRWSAILLSAALFGVIHGSLASFPQLALLGIIWALAYERTGNIAVPMLAHALYNLNTVILLLAGIES